MPQQHPLPWYAMAATLTSSPEALLQAAAEQALAVEIAKAPLTLTLTRTLTVKREDFL